MHRLASRDPAITPWASNRRRTGPRAAARLGRRWRRAPRPGREHLAGVRVEVGRGVLIPHGQAVAVVFGGVDRWPPDLVVGSGCDLSQLVAGYGSADRDVDVRCEPPLRFDGGDSVTDVQAAHLADIQSIGYANKPGKRERFIAAHAGTVINSLADLALALRGHVVNPMSPRELPN